MDVVCTTNISNYLGKPATLFLNRSIVEKLSLVHIYLNCIYVYSDVYNEIYSNVYRDIYSDVHRHIQRRIQRCIQRRIQKCIQKRSMIENAYLKTSNCTATTIEFSGIVRFRLLQISHDSRTNMVPASLKALHYYRWEWTILHTR